MTEQEKLVHNARVELNVAFLSRLGFISKGRDRAAVLLDQALD